MESELSSRQDFLPAGGKAYAVAQPDLIGRGDQGSGLVGVVDSGGPILPVAPARQPKVKPPKLYRIGEVVDYSGMSRQTIHNYTIMGLLHESKWTGGGHRLYDESVFERLDRIAELKNENMSMEAIREHLADKSR